MTRNVGRTDMTHSDDVHKTEVMIFGAEYVLRSSESAQYTAEVSRFVDEKMNRIADATDRFDTTGIALIAAFEIADQIVRQRSQHRKDRNRTAAAIKRLEVHLEDVKGET